MIRITTDLARTLVRYGASVPELAEVVQLAGEQLEHPNHFGDLVDTIAGTLADPRQNRLSNTSVSLLRSVVLSPLELAKWKVRTDQQPHCSGCEMPFASYEMAVVSGRNVFCWRCAHPEVVSCHSCRSVVDVGTVRRTIERAVARHDCATRPSTGQDAAVTAAPRDEGTWVVGRVLAPSMATQTVSTMATRAIRSISNPFANSNGPLVQESQGNISDSPEDLDGPSF